MGVMTIYSAISVPFGHSREFDVGGRLVTVKRTETGLHLIIEEHRAVVIHPQPNGRYIVTGPTQSDARSEPLEYEPAVRLALGRLRLEP